MGQSTRRCPGNKTKHHNSVWRLVHGCARMSHEVLLAEASRDVKARVIRPKMTLTRTATRRGPANAAIRPVRLLGHNGSNLLRREASCVAPGCFILPPGHSFLHIPKTGGTAVEQSSKKLGIEVRTSPQVHEVNRSGTVGSPWHLPPDMFQHVYGTPRSSKPMLCVVRDPADRLRSEASWRCTPWRSPKRYANGTSCQNRYSRRDDPEHDITSDAEEVLRARRRADLLRMGDRVLHMLPQSWHVWAEDGSVQCSCVVAYDKLARVLGLVPKQPSKYFDVRCPRSPALAALYSIDEELHANASADDRSLCYRPRPLPIGRLQEDHWRLWQRRQRRLCWRSLKAPLQAPGTRVVDGVTLGRLGT
jgi:hypothetical protein